jgi:hypothetical protein
MNTNPDLTILLFVDVEKDRQFDRRFFDTLRHLNASAMDHIQVVVLCQRDRDPQLEELVSTLPCDREVVYCEHPKNDAGYPVWDVCAGVRQAWPRVRGEYVTFSHTEYANGPDRIRRTCDWLMSRRPVFAMGNLRRVVPHRWDWRKRRLDIGDEMSLCLTALVDGHYWDFLREQWSLFTGHPWVSWQPQPGPGSPRPWLEDVFFARRDWLEVTRFFHHGGDLPFQDVYDLVGPGLERLCRHKVGPVVWRLDRETHEACHIAHTKCWGSYTAAMRRYFERNRKAYRDTTMIRWDLWDAVLKPDGCGAAPGQAVSDFRRAPGGTVTRWCADFSGYLQTGGEEKLREYMESGKHESR